MSQEPFSEEAEKHWLFIEELLKWTLKDMGKENKDLAHFLYVAAMIHGFKHGVQFQSQENQKEKTQP